MWTHKEFYNDLTKGVIELKVKGAYQQQQLAKLH